MDTAAEGTAWRVARALGVTQEARRLGARAVGTEHVLMATMSDPTVRRLTQGLGHTLRDVQELVTAASEERNRRAASGIATLTPEATTLLTAPPVAGTGERPASKAISRALRRLMAELLSDERDTAARRILLELDMIEHAPILLVAVLSHTEPPLPRPPGTS